MNYPKSQKYSTAQLRGKIMGPNPVKLTEELLIDNMIPVGSMVLDLGSGQGLTSVFLAKEYGFKVVAGDMWSDPEENRAFFASMGLSDSEVMPLKLDAENPLVAPETFDAVVSVDSYNYFGRNANYLDGKLLPCIRKGGLLYLSFPGMKRDLHNDLPPELLLSWTPEQLDYLHDIEFWKKIFGVSQGAELLSIYEMKTNEEAWNDWLACENEYAVNDRKTMNAGGGKYLNFIGVVLRKK